MGKSLAAFVLILVLLPVAASPLAAQSLPSSTAGQLSDSTSREGGGGHYVEFRVARIGTYGHSYAVYGSHKGRPSYADLHPMGGYLAMTVGHLVPVPANTEWNPEVASLPVAASYRRNLSIEQYQKLVAKVRVLRSKPGYWNAFSNNCNHFIGELAQAIGLRVPATFQVSYTFVPTLRALNEAEKPEARTRKPSRAAQAPSS